MNGVSRPFSAIPIKIWREIDVTLTFFQLGWRKWETLFKHQTFIVWQKVQKVNIIAERSLNSTNRRWTHLYILDAGSDVRVEIYGRYLRAQLTHAVLVFDVVHAEILRWAVAPLRVLPWMHLKAHKNNKYFTTTINRQLDVTGFCQNVNVYIFAMHVQAYNSTAALTLVQLHLPAEWS